MKFKIQSRLWRDKITIQNVKIILNQKIKNNCYRIILHAPMIAKNALPGQFVNVKISDGYEPFLRRPFSIHQAEGSSIELLYEVVGKGTFVLSQKRAGEHLDIIGPLGNGFDYQLPITNYQLPILVAGGMGVAPLIFLAKKLAEIQNPKGPKRKFGKVEGGLESKIQSLVLMGTKTKSQILCEKEFRQLGCRVKIATDDGSRGFKGKVTDLLKNLLPITNYQLPITIYACGPRPMLKEISRIAQDFKMPAQVSLEEHLACGIGACLGCVVKTKDGYQRVCKEGPVFNAEEIIWE